MATHCISDTDASIVTIGGIAQQVQNRNIRVIAYGSRISSKAQRKIVLHCQGIISRLYHLKKMNQKLRNSTNDQTVKYGDANF